MHVHELPLHFIIETPIASISLYVPSTLCPATPVLSTGVLVALIVVGVMLLVSLIGHALTTVYIVVLKRRSGTSSKRFIITVIITVCIYVMMQSTYITDHQCSI